ncbi:S-layer homology domain-containing protein [Paenibacillus eucommiae]|uniref:SLH domain-containing protein n=1 Tax=Paenibacillus eucommiae TaxID=1355755 RepID=A0ABS4J1E6_9BACL|nr:S-layer homology domain-containing protein [Paenibacillus eucommiae]MBP1993662.1 hypothetical protein [Paenibacillus eucommiae]
MILTNYKKRTFLLFMMFCLIFSTYGPAVGTVFGAESDSKSDLDSMDTSSSSRTVLADLTNHWAEKPLTAWMEAGLIHGYSDGTFKPDRIINRGEVIALINRSFGFNAKTPIHFTDLSASDWEYEDAARAVQAGYIDGYPDGTIGTKRSISRQEAAVIIARIMKLDVQAESGAANSFADAKQIPEWSKGAVAAVAAAGLMEGYEDGSFKPEAFITRAEVVVALDRALHASTALEYKEAGVYGAAANDVQAINGDVVVLVPGVTLQNMKITGDLLLAEGIAEGEVFLKNVEVLGTTAVKGGGINSVHVENSAIGSMIVDKASGVVRIVVEGNTVIAAMIVRSSVILSGYFDQVDVEAKNIVVEFTQGVIKQLSIAEQAAGTHISVDKNAKIISLILHQITKVMGQGIIEKAALSEKAKGTTFDKQPLLLTGAGAPAPVSGSSFSSGSYNPNPSTPPVLEETVSYSAVNGAITVSFDKLPGEAPVIGDFVVKQIIGGTDEILVMPSDIAWYPAEKKAVLTLPTISQLLVEQRVVYRVSYKGRATVDTLPFVVPVLDLHENNILQYVFDEMPAQVPSAGNFKIERMDNGDIVNPMHIAWDETTLTAALTVPSISPLPWEQYVEYEITYDGKEPVRTNAVTIARKNGYTSVLANSSFEQWTGASADSWLFWGEGFTHSDTIKRSGQYSLTVNGLSANQNEVGGGGPIQITNLEPGHYVGVFHYLTSAQTAGTLRYVLQYRNEDSVMIGSTLGEIQQGGKSNGKWTTASFEFDVYPDYSGLQMSSAQLILNIQNFHEGESVYLDDIELIRQDDVVPFMQASAENGTVRLMFNEEPARVPVLSDFKIEHVGNGGFSGFVTPTHIEWDATTLTAALTVPSIASLPWEQYVEYEVTYSGKEPIRTNSATITRQEGYTSVLANSSFEQWSGGGANSWLFWGEGFAPSDTFKRSGRYSLTANGFSAGQNAMGGGAPIQIVHLEPGHYVGVFHYLTSAYVDGNLQYLNAKLFYQVQFKDANGLLIGTANGPFEIAGTSNGKWKTVSFEFDVFSHYAGRPAVSAELILLIQNFREGEKVYLDDIELIRKD